MGSPVERITLTLPNGDRLVLERNYIYSSGVAEPVGVDPASAQAWLNGFSIPVPEALALVEKMRDDAEERAHG